MPARRVHFVAGLPRSGSTLLLNILGQNPRFRVGSTSGIMDVMFGVRNNWDKLIEFRASPNPEGKLRVLRGILESYYADSELPVVFDKCRGWISTGMLEMAETVLGRNVKILVPVRDLREVLASFEKLHRKLRLRSQGRNRRTILRSRPSRDDVKSGCGPTSRSAWPLIEFAMRCNGDSVTGCTSSIIPG